MDPVDPDPDSDPEHWFCRSKEMCNLDYWYIYFQFTFINRVEYVEYVNYLGILYAHTCTIQYICV